MNKNEIRKKYIDIRKNINEIDRIKKSKIISDKVLSNEALKSSKVIAIYKSLKSEVDTDNIINDLWSMNKVVLIPKVEKDIINFYEYNINDKLIKSTFGVLEPNNNKIYKKENIDLIIVPGVCFDKYMNRMGFGKGYYDKYLENSNIYKIGICFNEQIYDKKLVTDKYDIKMNEIITDKEVYYE